MIFKSNVSIFPNGVIYHYAAVCLWSGYIIKFSQLFNIEPEKTVCYITMQGKICAKRWVHYSMKAVYVFAQYTHCHHYTDLCESIEIIECL